MQGRAGESQQYQVVSNVQTGDKTHEDPNKDIPIADDHVSATVVEAHDNKREENKDVKEKSHSIENDNKVSKNSRIGLKRTDNKDSMTHL